MTDQQRQANWERARAGASAALGRKPRPVPWRASRELRALGQLRIDIAAGLPRDALLERIDDMIFRARNQKAPGRSRAP